MRQSPRPLRLASVALALCCIAGESRAQRSEERPTRVLVLYQQQAETGPMLEFGEHLRRALQDDMRSPVEFYQEALDFDRFAQREHSPRLVGYFQDKYRGFGIDVVVPVGGRALTFAIEHLRVVLPETPIVFALCAEPQEDRPSLPAHVTGRMALSTRFGPTLEMARRLQPDAERIVVVGGAGPSDSAAVSAAERAAHSVADSIPVMIIQGLPLDALLPKLRKLPRRSIVLFANYREDGKGRSFEPSDVVGSFARAAAAPMYTQLRSYVGEGLVGGSATRFDEEGVHTARLVARVLRRERGEAMPPVQYIQNSFIADWRQLRRWDLAESRLPLGTTVLFREPTPWERYRLVALAAFVIASAEFLLIARLLIERRQRMRGQVVLEEQQRRAEEARRQIAHMGRVALVGELAATISHEIRQPLAAIQGNAEAGARFLSRDAPEFLPAHKAFCEMLFQDIAAENEHASAIITRVRTLLRREEMPRERVDMNVVCRSAARLLEHEAAARHAEIIQSLCSCSPIVLGDAVEFQQVVLNLALNALDACRSSAEPRVVISTEVRDAEVIVAVQDNGTGITADVRQHLFQSFYTTKSTGLGLGLAIVQSIVERHQGRVDAESKEGLGATFRVRFPRLSTAEESTGRRLNSSLLAIRPVPGPSRSAGSTQGADTRARESHTLQSQS
jgi:signal transduction histidine kinase